jgi:hypothetical protein
MRRRVSSILSLFLALSLPIGVLAGDPPVPAELMQAKTVYIQTSLNPADYVVPCRDELNRWGRFKVVDDPKDADLIFRISNRDNQPPVHCRRTCPRDHNNRRLVYDPRRGATILRKGLVVGKAQLGPELEP